MVSKVFCNHILGYEIQTGAYFDCGDDDCIPFFCGVAFVAHGFDDVLYKNGVDALRDSDLGAQSMQEEWGAWRSIWSSDKRGRCISKVWEIIVMLSMLGTSAQL